MTPTIPSPVLLPRAPKQRTKLQIYRRHVPSCGLRGTPRGERETECACPIWIYGRVAGVPVRRSINLTDWKAAQKQVELWTANPEFLEYNPQAWSQHVEALGCHLTTDVAPGTIGAISELLITADLMNRGFHVFRGVGPHCSCDLIAVAKNVMLRVEVKTGAKYKNGYNRSTRDYDPEKFDVLAVVTRDDGVIYRPGLPSIAAPRCSA